MIANWIIQHAILREGEHTCLAEAVSGSMKDAGWEVYPGKYNIHQIFKGQYTLNFLFYNL
jgi:hypothetical protein